MRQLFIATLLCILPAQVLAQTARSLAHPRPVKRSNLFSSSGQVFAWENRLMSHDPKVRATAEAALVQDGGRSLPVLRRFLNRGDEELELRTFKIIQRIGPPALPLLVELLRDKRDYIRRSALNELIDLTPETEMIQPALRRALKDDD